jgi:hypothetical protein
LQTFADAFQKQSDWIWFDKWDYYDPSLMLRQRSAPVTVAKEMSGEDPLSVVGQQPCAAVGLGLHLRSFEACRVADPRFGMVCDRRYYLQLAMTSRRCRAIPKVLVRYRQT